MKIEELLSGQLASLTNPFIEWFDCLRQPFLSIERALSGCTDDKERLRHALNLWATSFLIGLVLQLPVYEFLGMDWQKAGFLLPSALLTLLLFLGGGIAIHFGLSLNRVPSNLVETCLIYTVIIAPPSPLLTLLFYPSLELVSKMVQSQEEQKKEGSRTEETRQTEGALAI